MESENDDEKKKKKTLVHLIESSKAAARAQAFRLIVPLEVLRLLERRPYLASVAYSLNQLLARQSPSNHENSWRFHVDLGYVGESALLTGRIGLSWCTALFCDRPRPGNDPGDDPDLSCTVPSGDTAHTAHAVRLPDVLRRCESFPRSGKLPCWYVVCPNSENEYVTIVPVRNSDVGKQ